MLELALRHQLKTTVVFAPYGTSIECKAGTTVITYNVRGPTGLVL